MRTTTFSTSVRRVNELSGYVVGVFQSEVRQRAAAACGTSGGCRGTDFVAAGRPQYVVRFCEPQAKRLSDKR